MLDRVPLLEKDLDDYARRGRRRRRRPDPRARPKPFAGRAGPPPQRHRVRRRRRRAARHARAAAAERRHRRRLAGDARQRRVLRRHQGGAQRAAGRRHRVDAARCSAPTSRRCSTTRCCSKATTTSSSSTTRSRPRCSASCASASAARCATPRGSGAATSTSPTPTPKVWEFFRPFVELYDASVWTMPEFVPASLDMDHVVHAPPCIDPLSVKNLDLADAVLPGAHQAVRHRRAPADRVPGQPVRPVEGPGRRDRGVPHRARAGARRAARARGLDGHRRPRGLPGLGRRPRPRAAATATSTCCRTCTRSGAVQINAFQRIADVVVQKSLREGFGLTVSEGALEGPAGRRRARRRHQAADPRRLRRLPRRLRRGVRAAHHRPARRPRRRRRAWAPGPRARARELPLDARARGLAEAVRRL